MKRRTKIVATLGPASGSREIIGELIQAGVNVFRLNCSHGTWDLKHEWIRWIRELSPALGSAGILVDLQGPKFRIGALPEGIRQLQTGELLTIGASHDAELHVPGPEICAAMATNDRLLLGDGEVEIKLGQEIKESTFTGKVITGGAVKSKQGVTIIGKVFDTQVLTEKDKEDIFEAAKAGADIVALSYVHHSTDIRDLRRILDSYGSKASICAKIETKQAVKELHEIALVADIVMVARGDLGLQMDLEDVPIIQKKIIKQCNQLGKPVITATQMLESMMTNARPTRAETTDIANAILDGTDAVMLSGESAAGAYPVVSVKTMSKIAETAEATFDNLAYFETMNSTNDHTSAVAEAAVQIANTIKAKAILTTSTSGLTPRLVSKFRPNAPILCAAWTAETQGLMSVCWGVESLQLTAPEGTDEVIHRSIDALMKQRRLKVGDTIVVTAGVPAGQVGGTNLIKVERIH